MAGETRHDIRYAVIDYLKDCECWVSFGDIHAMLESRGIPLPAQLPVVLWNMVKGGWLKKGKAHSGSGGVRYYLVEGQICRSETTKR